MRTELVLKIGGVTVKLTAYELVKAAIEVMQEMVSQAKSRRHKM